MLRVVLCIICLHPFLWLFLLALLYHTVKDFFRVNFAENVRVLLILDGLQISWRRGAEKSCGGESLLVSNYSCFLLFFALY